MEDLQTPTTPTQKYLAKIAGTYNEPLPTPISPEEKYLYYIAVNGSGGGGSGGTTNYNALENKPSVNGVTLTGNKTTEDLNIIIPDVSVFVTDTEIEELLADYVTATVFDTALSGKVDKISGKVLSDNNYSTAEKTKLAGLENYDDTELKQLTGNTYIPCSSAKILSSGDDLNNLTDYDIWLATNGTVAKSLLNSPHTEGGFLVWNSPVTTRFSNMFYQYLVGNNADDVLCYRRKWFDGTWNSWYKFTGTPV